MTGEDARGRYDRLTVALHWWTAGLVAALWVVGQVTDWLPRGPIRSGLWSAHVVFGFALAAILIARIGWRATQGTRLPSVQHGLMKFISEGAHYLLYALLVLVVTLGIINAFVRAFSIFGLFSLPQLGDPAMRHDLTEWHGTAANILMIVAAVHAVAALFHHLVLRDRLIARMGLR